MHKHNIFLKIITYGPLFFIPLIIGIILFITINMYKTSFEDSLHEVEIDLHKLEQKAIETKVLNISDIIVYRKHVIKDELKSRVKNRVEQAHKIANSIYEKYKEIKQDEEIKELIKISLRPFIWNGGESFIWMIDFDGIFKLAPAYLKHLEGTSIINLQDATGRYVIKEEINIAKNKGAGFLWDTFTKPNGIPNKQYEQVAYVKALGHYDWYLGSAEYLDTATKITDKQIIDTIENIDRLDKNYIILMNINGDMLISKSSPELVGKNMFNIDNQSVKNAVKNVINALKDKDEISLTYNIINPVSKKIEEKYSFFTKVPNSDWIVGSGFYLSDVENRLSIKKIDMYDEFYSKSKSIAYVALFFIILAFIFSYYISKKLKESFIDYEKNIDEQNMKLKELNETLEHKVEHRTIELERMKNDFEILATTDSLTKIHNRYSLMKILSSEVKRSQRYNTPLSAILLDIDFFKKVNDTYGHDIGDIVLANLSNLVVKSLRDIDTFGRYGGEEFMILFPGTSLVDTNIYAERLREEVSQHVFESVGNITISIGLAELKENETVDNFFKRLDDLLYKSKDDGRNKVSF